MPEIVESDERKAKIAAVLRLISGGMSVRRACEQEGIARTTFFENAPSDLYARARAMQADCHFDDLSEMAGAVAAGAMEPQACRAAADIIKWQVARMKPSAYGDRVAMELTGKDGGPVQHLDVSKMTDEQLHAILAQGQVHGDEE